MKVNIQAVLSDPFVAKLNGVVSRGIKEADINEEGHLIFTLTDDSTVDLGKVVGDTGPAGRDGRDGSDGAPGQPGADGHSPVVTAQKSGTTTTIKVDGVAIATISDGAPGQQGTPGTPGTPGRDGSPGTPGQDGEDGFSPTVSVTTITGGHRVTITDAEGDHSFNVMDGSGGGGGVSVHGQLTGRDASDQHPMSAITGLTQALSGKQGTISDLSTIRSGAALGATALQSVPATYRTAAAQDAIDATKQGKLTAGENITIDGDVISATGGGSTEISIGQQTPSGEEVLWIDPDGSGGGGGADLAWKKIATVSASSAANEYVLTVDSAGNPFSYKEIGITFTPQLSGYFYIRADYAPSKSGNVQFWVTNGKETHITLGLFDGKLALSSVCRTDGAVGYTGSGGGNTAFDSVSYLLFGASAGFTAAQNINIFGR